MNATTPASIEELVGNVIANQLLKELPTSNPTYVTIALIVVLLLTHAGSWLHLSQTFKDVVEKCVSTEAPIAAENGSGSDTKISVASTK